MIAIAVEVKRESGMADSRLVIMGIIFCILQLALCSSNVKKY